MTKVFKKAISFLGLIILVFAVKVIGGTVARIAAKSVSDNNRPLESITQVEIKRATVNEINKDAFIKTLVNNCLANLKEASLHQELEIQGDDYERYCSCFMGKYRSEVIDRIIAYDFKDMMNTFKSKTKSNEDVFNEMKLITSKIGKKVMTDNSELYGNLCIQESVALRSGNSNEAKL